MIIESMHVKNFRSILEETLNFEGLTALVGANGSGKSTFLRALELFYSTSPKFDMEDFYNSETGSEASIAVTYKELSEAAKDRFRSYMQGDKLTVERVFSWDGSKAGTKLHGSKLQNPDLQAARDAGSATDKKAAYESLRSKKEYSNFPKWKNATETPEFLSQWELENPSKCRMMRDEGQFFGFKEVGEGYLGRFTQFLFIPAVRDASADAAESRGSVLTTLMDLVVRSVIANKEAVVKLKEETQRQYKDIMDVDKLTELKTLSDQINTTLKTFVSDASVVLKWLPLGDIDIPMPKADVKLKEDSYESAVIRAGHGLQRAFILTMLQHLAIAQASSTKKEEVKKSDDLPCLVLAIEEPELYQHPNRQRHLAKILLRLASGETPGVAHKTQIVYSTHSPLFVGIDRIDQIRLLRKILNEEGKPKVTKIITTNLDEVAATIWEADGATGDQFTGKTLLPRLQAIMTPWMNEGFFADVAVLVEGEDDRAAMLGIAKGTKGVELESEGFSVIPCGGKTGLDRPATIFQQLGIPVYIIWDSDKGNSKAKPKDNHRLLRLMKQKEEDWPSKIEDNFACFEEKLEKTLCNEIGAEYFEKCLTECRDGFCIPEKEHAIKNPTVIATIIQKAQGEGRTSITLNSILDKIMALKK
ncbi:MAG: ATP-dependent endonuclease [Thermodesulfobacteriota bacterium]